MKIFKILIVFLVACSVEMTDFPQEANDQNDQFHPQEVHSTYNPSYTDCSTTTFTKIPVNNKNVYVRNIALCTSSKPEDKGYPLPDFYNEEFSPIYPESQEFTSVKAKVNLMRQDRVLLQYYMRD